MTARRILRIGRSPVRKISSAGAASPLVSRSFERATRGSATSTPVVPGDTLTTEAGDVLTTEAGDPLTLET